MPTSAALVRQAGAIAVSDARVCVVTSRSGKRWVIPKGCMEPGKTAGEVALMEAWEEAGLVGVLEPEPLGSYVYEKAGATCHVTVFLLRVTEVAASWPEQGWRARSWLTFAQAQKRLEDLSLREIIRGLAGHKADLNGVLP
jgi:8-oxo-dGTP pyrophosphatase MutT (NUDIX family)